MKETLVKDIDGNSYKTVKIGEQIWMAENLKVTQYRNGDPIPNLTDENDWENTEQGAYCNYDNNEDKVKTYGRLYNWYAVDDKRGLAPNGWLNPCAEIFHLAYRLLFQILCEGGAETLQCNHRDHYYQIHPVIKTDQAYLG